MEKVRIHKVMAAAGVGSLRACEKMVQDGRVTVNGRPAEIGMPVIPGRDLIAVDGVNVSYDRKMKKRYILLNKPRGYVTTASDELGRKTVFDLLGDVGERVFPIGRLDRNSEGLLLLTNDGELANKLMHPSSHVDKKYRVTVSDDVDDEMLVRLTEGVVIDGQKTAPAVVRVLVKEAGRVVLEMSIYEGKNRQIRKMCEAVGLTVVRLKRTAEGPVRLGMVQPGKWRDLTPAEVGALRNAAEKRERGRKPRA